MEYPNYLTVNEVARILKVDPKTVYRYCHKGYLIYTQPTKRKMYITVQSLNDFLKYGKQIIYLRQNLTQSEDDETHLIPEHYSIGGKTE